MLICLVLVCAVSGGLLAFIDSQTAPVIAQQNINTTVQGIKEVTPESDNDPYADRFLVAVDGDSLMVYPAKLNGTTTGYAVESTSSDGFSGNIRILIGIDNEGKVVDYRVLEQAETPGLGAHVTHWFHSEEHPTSDIRGKSLTEPLKVTKDNGEIDAITAATITSRAFLGAVNKAMRAVASAEGNDTPPTEEPEEAAPFPAEAVDVETELVESILPEHDNSPADERILLTDEEGYSYTLYPATRGGIQTGAAITTGSRSGFNGDMIFLIAVDGGGHLLDYAVLEENESEGIGDQVSEWFHDSARPSSDLRGRSLDSPLKLTADGGTIDGMTGATITGRAFLDAVNRAAAMLRTADIIVMDAVER